MNLYNLGYDTYEESEYIQLSHKHKYSDEEFKKIVRTATTNVITKLEIKENERISFQDIIEDVAEELIKTFGFKRVKFDAEFSVFGWANILDKDDWKEVRGEELNKLTDFVNIKLKKKSKLITSQQ